MNVLSVQAARIFNPVNAEIFQNLHSSLRTNMVHIKDTVPPLQRCKANCQVACLGCDRTYTGHLYGNNAQRTPELSLAARAFHFVTVVSTTSGHSWTRSIVRPPSVVVVSLLACRCAPCTSRWPQKYPPTHSSWHSHDSLADGDYL